MDNNDYGPKPSSTLFDSLIDKQTIILAVNPRISHVNKGIMKAAKDFNAPIILELAKSECNLEGGYTGFTPLEFSKRAHESAKEIGMELWSLHADHIGIKEGSPEEITSVKKLVKAQIDAGYTSFAIDASHLFNFSGGNLEEELKDNIDATTEIANFIDEKMDGKPYGLEVEVGEIGREDEYGRVLTTPEEAVTFIKALNSNNVYPHVLAIANGSAHGNTYDSSGNLIEQVSIDIPQTKKVAKALRDNNLKVRIAQHGITGTPLDLIHNHFPHGDIIKGNVGTFYLNIVWDVLKVFEPDLYKDIWNWTIESFSEKAPNKSNNEIFGKYGKHAIKQFFNQIYSVDEDTIKAIESKAYSETLMFLKAFKCEGTAELIANRY
ncbi:class II fructose-bisphosphate aldolase [Methanosalsum natronophilum]|uniref:Class II fructose-bisphosphate aldolase n=1 Tax=Methanosalsum natronophilum TaxID=768733 RepID=A0A424YYT4_9EURY|nr:class II fructose-bisphosphate aldolase [Methanosalsum natronophilum]MCS3923479.1 fructose-bisphosphate aldolase class II [Methanosalsum natronophilum]RQD86154.1 MAG: class II fructose-bisphosphate aldolase [Methanosalsum natronophilum]